MPPKKNPCASVANNLNSFANLLQYPPFINHSMATDRLDVMRDILNVDTSEERAKEEQKFETYNRLVLETQQKQIRYILRELGKCSGRKPEDVEKYLPKGNMTHKEFRNAYKELSVKVDSEGRMLNSRGKVLDLAKWDQPFQNEKELPVDRKEIRRIVMESANEDIIGGVEENFDKLIEERDKSTKRIEFYKKTLTDQLLKETGYTKQYLNDRFEYCFSFRRSIPENFRRARKACIKERMNALPEYQRTETKFLEECEKLDLAMRVYVLPQNDVKADDKGAFSVPKNRKEYEKFALEFINPTATAKAIEDDFNSCFTREKGGIDTRTALGCLVHLQELHSKRSTWERFKDWFRFGRSETSTISRMKERIENQIGKDNVETLLKNGKYDYPNKTIDERYTDLSHDAKFTLDSPIAINAAACFIDAEVDLESTEQLQEQITADQQANKEYEQEHIIEGNEAYYSKIIEDLEIDQPNK